jgi:hypothetical protein
MTIRRAARFGRAPRRRRGPRPPRPGPGPEAARVAAGRDPAADPAGDPVGHHRLPGDRPDAVRRLLQGRDLRRRKPPGDGRTGAKSSTAPPRWACTALTSAAVLAGPGRRGAAYYCYMINPRVPAGSTTSSFRSTPCWTTSTTWTSSTRSCSPAAPAAWARPVAGGRPRADRRPAGQRPPSWSAGSRASSVPSRPVTSTTTRS